MLRRSTGGIGRYTRELLKAMLPMAPDMEFVIFLTSEDAKEFSSNLPNVQLKITDIPHYSLQEQTKLPGILNAEKLDLVHFLNFNHPLTYKKPFVTTLHDLTLLLFPGHGRKKPNPIRFALFKKVFLDSLHRAEKIIAISQYTAQDAHNRLSIPHEKMDIVLEGGPEPLMFAFNTRNVVTEALQSEAPYFLFVSNWRPHKGLNTLISAFEKFKKETNLPHLLALVGNREAASPSVLEAIENSPYKAEIKQLGFVSDEILPNLFNNSTAFIMPSECEGFGLPILEAYAYGAPVIAADNTSLLPHSRCHRSCGAHEATCRISRTSGQPSRCRCRTPPKVLVEAVRRANPSGLPRSTWKIKAPLKVLRRVALLNASTFVPYRTRSRVSFRPS
jgi:glycosyltransferase involved in cell wall biosynthesis